MGSNLNYLEEVEKIREGATEVFGPANAQITTLQAQILEMVEIQLVILNQLALQIESSHSRSILNEQGDKLRKIRKDHGL